MASFMCHTAACASAAVMFKRLQALEIESLRHIVYVTILPSVIGKLFECI
jgi:hypothetical protein